MRAVGRIVRSQVVLGLGYKAVILFQNPRHTDTSEQVTAAPLRKSRKIVITLAALFSLDSFGSGFVVQSLGSVVVSEVRAAHHCDGNGFLLNRRAVCVLLPSRRCHGYGPASRTCRRQRNRNPS